MSRLIKTNRIPFWREIKSNGRRPRIGKYGAELGERGIYDKRNPLNELTGREWIYFTNSVWVTAYPPSAGKNSGFDFRKVHPSPKPPQLLRDIVYFFTKRNQWILDPFVGVGGTLLGASLCSPPRNAIGIDLNPIYKRAYKKACKLMSLQSQKFICGDSRNLLSFKEIKNNTFDLILTDPPYSDMMVRQKNGQKKKLYGKDDPTPFNENDKDLGNLPYNEFLADLKKIISLSITRLKLKGYLVLFCKDLQPVKTSVNLIHADVIRKICEIPNIQYRGQRIWYDQATDLYPFGYPYAFVMNQMHQYILIFRKEK
jgi:DNA modification methylase